jgi:hypothetical protein
MIVRLVVPESVIVPPPPVALVLAERSPLTSDKVIVKVSPELTTSATLTPAITVA